MSLTRSCPGRNSSTFSDTPTVFVVDGDAAVREALQPVIRSAGWLPCPAASAEEFLARPRAVTPSCILTELQLPGVGGLDLQRLIVGHTQMPIIFMSQQFDVKAVVQAMKAGALEVLIKPLVTDVLLSALGHAIERSRAVLSQLAQMRALEARYALLTAREREVMSLVVSGRLNKQIGDDLGICEITVKAHRGSVMRKMQARSLAALVTMVATLRSWSSNGGDHAPALRNSRGQRYPVQWLHAWESRPNPY